MERHQNRPQANRHATKARAAGGNVGKAKARSAWKEYTQQELSNWNYRKDQPKKGPSE